MDEPSDLRGGHSPQSVKVEIYSQSYNIRGNGDPGYITQLADFVDRRMREVAAATLTVDSLKVAILAALNIADELHQLKGRHEEMDTELTQKTNEFTQLFDQVFQLKDEEPESSDNAALDNLGQS